jgi:hypothetical protein
VSLQELDDLLDGTRWRVARTLGSGLSYVAVIEKRAFAIRRADWQRGVPTPAARHRA